MLDSIYHMTLKLFWIHIFGVKKDRVLPYASLKASFHNVSQKYINHEWFIIS